MAHIANMDLKAARKQLGMTQGQFAEALGLDRTGIYRREVGTTPVEKRTALAVEALLHRAGIAA